VGHLQVQDLSFQYPNAAQPALEGVSFDLRPGASLGIVGEVGAGKSTLLRLLLRLYEPPGGSICLDGRDIATLNLKQLRQQVAWVEQEAFLFSRSIRENLLLGNPEASPEMLVEVARRAQLHDEVMSFPNGYETMLGERGVLLSGGQKQRLCLARALLKAAPILVLDDTLSAVDANTERLILESLRQVRGQQTLLVISHRVSAVRELDEILVFDQGKVVQRGDHQKLLAEPGLYRRLFELQSQGGS
jgi:ATP-binding cassette subfamily B protein